MKKIYNIFIVGFLALAFSCADDNLDPLQFKSVKKGTILALRGTQLKNIYVNGIPGAELFPKIATGSEKFNFDAEFLSEDPNSLSSFDIYVIKRTGSAREKVFLSNVPFSSFKTTSDYLRPWVSVSLSSADILSKLGITFPLDKSEIDALLTTYGFGVQMECDLNLTDGTKVLASDLVAAGLYQSDQFYPAQKLTYAMTDYCSYDAASWSGQWFGDEVGTGVSSPDGGDNLGNFVAIGPNQWRFDNFFGDGTGVYAKIEFTPSSDPDTQIVKYLNDPGLSYQVNSKGKISGSGTYNQCLQTLSLNTTYVIGTTTYKWRYDLHR